MFCPITHYVPDAVLCAGDTVLDGEGRPSLLDSGVAYNLIG